MRRLGLFSLERWRSDGGRLGREGTGEGRGGALGKVKHWEGGALGRGGVLGRGGALGGRGTGSRGALGRGGSLEREGAERKVTSQ